MPPSLQNLYLASPDEFFSTLEMRLAAIEARVGDLASQVETMAALSDNIALRALALSNRGPAPTAWSYDARLPNVYFSGLFEPETVDGVARRWVGAQGRIEGQLLLDRRWQYRLEVEAVDFVTKEAEASFQLLVDGRPWPWLATDGRVFTTIVGEAPHETGLEFALEIAAGTRPADRDVSFAFRRIGFSRAE